MNERKITQLTGSRFFWIISFFLGFITGLEGIPSTSNRSVCEYMTTKVVWVLFSQPFHRFLFDARFILPQPFKLLSCRPIDTPVDNQPRIFIVFFLNGLTFLSSSQDKPLTSKTTTTLFLLNCFCFF